MIYALLIVSLILTIWSQILYSRISSESNIDSASWTNLRDLNRFRAHARREVWENERVNE
jgi:hypothetical protein